jgi:hypothetical protein
VGKKTGKTASSAGGVEVMPPPRRKTVKATNRLHPVQVEFSYPIGSRVDMIDHLPPDLADEDPAELIERFSSPREYEERLAPVSITFNQETMAGKNGTELQVKFIRTLGKRLERVAEVLERANRETFGEKGPVPFFGLGLDPATITRIIELDYETADNVYSRIVHLWDNGHATPVATIPFHPLMPQHQSDFELRLLARIALEFYWGPILKHNRRIARTHGEDIFVCVLWLPEGGFTRKVLEVFHQEFVKRCEEEQIANPHLVLLLDTEQSRERETDLLMKRWNTLRPSPTTRDIVTIIYKERLFSDWVVQGHPSTKKQLDRTIAKVDAVLRDQQIDHLWSHFEPLMTLVSTFKTCVNFEQKLIKLTELGYQPCGPDVFVRRKMLRRYGMEEDEPRRTMLEDNTCWAAYPDTPGSLVRFLGTEDANGRRGPLGAERPYARRMPDGIVRKSRGNPCWKPALWAALTNVHRAIVGDPKTFMGGMLGLLREILPIRRVPVARRNIEDFLVRHARIHWKEHFIHHLHSEADIRLDEFVRECLLANRDDDTPDLSDEEIVVAGVAAEAIYHAYAGMASTTFAWEHLDHRAAYNNIAMMCLGAVFGIYALKWTGRDAEADALYQVYKTELLDFRNAYTRHGIDKLGIEEKLWRATIKSQVADSDLNLVERVARRIGANHLRLVGYRNDFDRRDSAISTSCGHIWSHEIGHLNFKWENELFCGLAEE